MLRRNGRTQRPSEPYVPRNYPVHLRLVDRHHANRDAAAALPALDQEGALGTPMPEYLGRGAAALQQREWIRCQEDCAELRADLEIVRSQLAEAERTSAEAEAAVRELAAPATDEDLTRRRGGEDRTDESVVRTRRAQERSRRLAASRATAARAAERAAALTVQLRQAETRIAVRQELAAARAVHIHEQTMRRVVAYYRQLVRRHPDGARINAQLKLGGPELPSWAAPAGQDLR
jgi:ABC transport system ATP-binding/permease protein